MINIEDKQLQDIHAMITANTSSTKLNIYKALNLELSLNEVYQKETHYISDCMQTRYTRFRMRFHCLNIEKR